MKQFLKIWVMVLVVVEIFLCFGGWMLFDFQKRFYVAGAAVAFVAALLLNGFVCHAKRIEQLEKQVAALEEAQKKTE